MGDSGLISAREVPSLPCQRVLSQRFSLPRWLDSRRLNGRYLSALGARTQVCHSLYSAIRTVRSWDPFGSHDHTHHGAIFNFDFSCDGSLLGAACENKSILIFDPHNGSLLKAKDWAHSDCVNCIRFLDQRTFVTCSDDSSVRIWDVRRMEDPVHTLQGHSNWVKNIEFASGLLVTSGFDGNVYTWDINNYSDQATNVNRVFHTSGLMRSKLLADGSKMVIATTHGFLMVVHELNLSTLSADMSGFKPLLHRQMQQRRSNLLRHGPSASFNHVFTRKRNRVEFISDFPPGDSAGMIASLEIHPQGWCIASRNTTEDDYTEWTCVHDIQSRRQETPPRSTKHPHDAPTEEATPGPSSCPSTPRKRRRLSQSAHPVHSDDALLTSSVVREHGQQADYQLNMSTVVGSLQNHLSASHNLVYDEPLLTPPGHSEVIKNQPRLMYYTEEPNVGQGFIKEIAFSSDGRMICSPFGYGVRLLTFDSECHELCDLDIGSPCQLHEVASNMSHTKEVVTTKFSPTHCLLVTGCLNGKVDFHQPVL